jgi:hypothetical protein
MDKGKIAEGFISLVMERAQAASVVGDLLETSTSRSTFWFWSNVFRTWTANVWRDGISHPRFVFGVAAYGTLLHVGIGLAVSIFFGIGIPIITFGLSHPQMFQVMSSLMFVERLIVILGCPFFIGRWIARFSSGKDVAVCVAMAILTPIAFAVLSVALWFYFVVIQGRPPQMFTWWSSWEMWFFVPYLLGAVLVPSRRQIAATS